MNREEGGQKQTVVVQQAGNSDTMLFIISKILSKNQSNPILMQLMYNNFNTL